jgi:hypothetical protein
MGWRQASETTGVQFLVSSGGQIRMSVDNTLAADDLDTGLARVQVIDVTLP